MTRTYKILFSILTIILGWLLSGFGYATRLGHPISTICFLLGFVLFISGFLFFIFFASSGGKTNSQKIHILNFKKQSAAWNHNLYDLCLSSVKAVQNTKYDYNAFDSWHIEFKTKRLIYNGKDSWLILQNKLDGNWIDEIIIKKEELNELNLFSLIDTI